MDIDETINYKTTSRHLYSESDPKDSRDAEKSEDDSNKLKSCTGEISDDQLKSIQEDLDRAKESNSFSSNSRCVICWSDYVNMTMNSK